MSKFVINVSLNKTNDAMSKAKTDVAFFLKEANFDVIDLRLFKNKIDKLLNTEKIIKRKFGELSNDDIVVIQYPTYLGYRFEKKLFKFLRSREVKTIGLIHDLDSVRNSNKGQHTLEEEIESLNGLSSVISSNHAMTRLLQNNGLVVPSVDLGVFDYHQNNDVFQKKTKSNYLNFAGNLAKSAFLNDFHNSDTAKLRLFGNYDRNQKFSKKSIYMGSFNPEELISYLNTGYGLVWDGESSHKITGEKGEYLLFNNPHKVSLYLSVGLPIIIWKEAALAPLIINNNAGIAVNTLDDIGKVLSSVSLEDYQEMCLHAKKLGEQIRKGFYIKTAVKKAMQL